MLENVEVQLPKRLLEGGFEIKVVGEDPEQMRYDQYADDAREE